MLLNLKVCFLLHVRKVFFNLLLAVSNSPEHRHKLLGQSWHIALVNIYTSRLLGTETIMCQDFKAPELKKKIFFSSNNSLKKYFLKFFSKKAFFTQKFVFHCMFAKFSFNLSPLSQILQHMSKSCLCNLGTCSKLRNVS